MRPKNCYIKLIRKIQKKILNRTNIRKKFVFNSVTISNFLLKKLFYKIFEKNKKLMNRTN